MTTSGLALLDRGADLLAASARTFTRAALPDATDAASPVDAPPVADVVDAAVGVIYARAHFGMGVALLEVGRDVERQLLDIVA